MRILLLTTALSVAVAPAFAWDNTTNGNHNQIVDGGPGAQANSHSFSRVTVSPTINVAAPQAIAAPSVTTPAAATAPIQGSGSSGASGDPAADPSSTTHRHSGGGRSGNVLVQQFPPASAYAAPLSGGPCNSSGVSGGAQTAWFGLSIAHQRFDYGCAGERMGDLLTVGQQLDWAYQCQDDERFRKASASIGYPCPGSEERQEASIHRTYTPAALMLPSAKDNLTRSLSNPHMTTDQLNALSVKAAKESNQ